MAEGRKEIHFEEHIVKYLTKYAQPEFPDYTEKDNSSYNKELCLIPEDIIGFIKDTQPTKYDALAVQYGPVVDAKIVERIAEELKRRKTLDVFREKVRDRGQILDLVYFLSANSQQNSRASGGIFKKPVYRYPPTQVFKEIK
jgi:type I restriction enzyme, R subunit